MVSDKELARRIIGGDREALAMLYDRYAPVLWRFACAHLRGNETAARDVVSEAFLAAIRNIRSLDASKGEVGAWLMGIARHKLADVLREKPAAPLIDVVGGETAHAALEEQESRDQVAEILSTLDDDQRLALEWKYLDRQPVRLIATRLGRTEKATEALLYRAREEFRIRYRAQFEKQERSS